LLVAGSNIVTSILNGLGETLHMAASIFFGALITVLAGWYGLQRYGDIGAGIGILAGALASGVLAWLFIRASGLKFNWRTLLKGVEERRSLLGYVGMAFASILSLPLVLIVIRSFLAEYESWAVAGQWSALWRLSEAYLMSITTLLSIYYLPRLAAAKSKSDVYLEIKGALIRFIPIVISLSLLIYLFRDAIIRIALSDEFMPISEIMPWQLTGDVLKVIALIFGNYMWAKGHVTAFIAMELIFTWIFAGVSVFLIMAGYGAKACAMAFMINYIIVIPFYIFWVVRS